MKLIRGLNYFGSRRFKSPKTTSWLVSGLGIAVSALGSRMLNRKVGAGILGFGLAHIVLGQLDRMRPTVKNEW
ncbi:MAG: hypothetical protein ACOC2G_04010 [Bacillota bacterium]